MEEGSSGEGGGGGSTPPPQTPRTTAREQEVRKGRKRALFRQTVLHSLKGMKSQIMKLTLAWGLVALVLMVGGYILMELEREHEQDMIKAHNKALEDIRIKLKISKDDMEEIQAVFRKHERCREHDKTHWTGSGGAFFMMTTFTTIGYGTFTPLTGAGRLFTILYGTIGIGILGMTLSRASIVTFHFLSSCRKFIMLALNLDRLDENDNFTESEKKNVTQQFDDRARAGYINTADLRDAVQALNDDEEPSVSEFDTVRNLADPASQGQISRDSFLEAIRKWYTLNRQVDRPMLWTQLIVGGVLLGCTLCTGAAIFPGLEGWSVGTSFWFCWASLTTIGYGDYAPRSETGQIVGIIYNLLGLGIISYNVNCVSRIFLKKMGQAERKFTQHTKEFRDAEGNLNTTDFALSFLSPRSEHSQAPSPAEPSSPVNAGSPSGGGGGGAGGAAGGQGFDPSLQQSLLQNEEGKTADPNWDPKL